MAAADGTRDAELYAELTARPVSGPAMEMYQTLTETIGEIT